MCAESEDCRHPSGVRRHHMPRKARTPLDNGLQHRLNIGRRGGDDVQDVGAAGLVREGLGQIAGAGLHLIEQLGVLDRNHRLIGEGGEQLHLPCR